jgi:hypothetical protein
MKKMTLFTCCLLIAGVGKLFAQTFQSKQKLYIPYNIQQAYKNGTRSKSGKPGPNYWENHGNYNISIYVNPPNRLVKGSETITYHNNSPDTLKVLVFSLIMNHHRPGAVRQGVTSKARMSTGDHIDQFVINGKTQKWNQDRHRTWIPQKLSQPLDPGDSVHLSIKWHYTLSKKSGREGSIDSTTFYLAYFYPRVTVYDDYNGWDRMNFTGAQEFYNDFNNYTFQVTVPRNYIVWATGKLQNPNQVLQPKYAKLLKKSMTSDSIIHVATPKDLQAGKITAQNPHNTWKWKAHDITDIAMAISNHYDWDASSVVVDPKTGRRASVQAAYADSAADFHHMVQYGRHALKWLSTHWPGVPYPFPKTTIVSGFADMEYPMMVNDRSTMGRGGLHSSVLNKFQFARDVVEHEISHSWFPFYMGTNQMRWGFMDEGWATMFEYLMDINDVGTKKAVKFFRRFRVDWWIHNLNGEDQIPIVTPGNVLSGLALGPNEYGKPALAYMAVKDLLGDDMFRKCLHGFIHRWHGKHPMPWDFFYTFNNISGQNLNWFWNNWFFSHNYMDIGIKGVKRHGHKMKVTIKNIGGFAIPFDVVMHRTNGPTQKRHKTPAIWKGHQNQIILTLKKAKNINKITLKTGIYVDADTTNNSWHP